MEQALQVDRLDLVRHLETTHIKELMERQRHRTEVTLGHVFVFYRLVPRFRVVSWLRFLAVPSGTRPFPRHTSQDWSISTNEGCTSRPQGDLRTLPSPLHFQHISVS